jgi:hypothetical protein
VNQLERYLGGEYEQVWQELQAMGAAALEEPNRAAATQVARETMRRVARNCTRLISRLTARGYRFGIYPDGSQGYYSMGSLVAPDRDMHADLAALEKAVGPIPLSLVAFWEEVGSVDLVGMRPDWPTGLDPLVVAPPAAGVSELDEMADMLDTLGHFEASLAPDHLHKDNISGGAPYAVELPNKSADFVLANERHAMLFVPYLRMAILSYGGFPGLEGRANAVDALESLTEGLEPF